MTYLPTEVIWVYDGKQLLESGNDPEGYTLYTKPRQSEGFELVRSLVLPPGSDLLARGLPRDETAGCPDNLGPLHRRLPMPGEGRRDLRGGA